MHIKIHGHCPGRLSVFTTVFSILILLSFFSPLTVLLHAKDSEDLEPAGVETREKDRFELDEVVVTATREEDTIREIPKNVTVITRFDIEQASSRNVVDLLAREANLNLRSFFGNDKKAGVDIRGMGDTFVSNVVVMVDGFRLNSPDLAGPDLSSIPLGRIERIEIVRGAGSVLYGDGAVGGVVNVITKKGESEPEITFHSSTGSYSTHEERASAGGTIHRFTPEVSAGYFSSEGYRDNGYLRKKDAKLQLGYQAEDHLSFSFGASLHDDRYGLPGTVSKADVDSENRRKSTNSPNDFGETEDRRYFGHMTLDMEKWGELAAYGTCRERYNPYIMGYNPLLSREEQTDKIDEETIQLGIAYTVPYDLAGLSHSVKAGIDYYNTDYLREEITKSQKKNSDVETLAWFVSNRWSLSESLKLNAGYRDSRFEGHFRDDSYEDFYAPAPPPPPVLPPTYLYSAWVTGETEKKIWNNNAFDIGLVYTVGPQTSLFVSYAKSFRIPNVDELALADEELRPQKGFHLDIGLRQGIADILEFALTLFQVKIEDEIYYGEDPVSKTTFNRNYDEKTVRHGAEADIKFYPSDALYLWGNFSYTDARFEGTDASIPLVPRIKASIGMEWQIIDALLLSLAGTAVGSRYDGNDQTNRSYEKLDAYQVVDGKLAYEFKHWKVFGGVNNIFNELYSTTSYSESYYPMPTRNVYVGVEWGF